MDTPMTWINLGAVTTVDIEVVFNRTLSIIGSEVFFQQSFLQMLSKSLVSLLLNAIPLFVTNFRYRHRF